MLPWDMETLAAFSCEHQVFSSHKEEGGDNVIAERDIQYTLHTKYFSSKLYEPLRKVFKYVYCTIEKVPLFIIRHRMRMCNVV